MNEKKQLSKSITVKINQNSYDIDFPTNAQLIDIESLKVSLSKDTQRSLMLAGTSASDLAFTTIEAFATFTVLIPALKQDLTKSLMELSPIETKPIVNQYTKVYWPWFRDWMEEINSDEKM